MADYYEVLGVSRKATSAEIRSAYLKLARDKHPDRHQDPTAKAQAQEEFKVITTAFNTLCNEKQRGEYDQELSRPKQATTPAEQAKQAYRKGLERFEARDYHEAVTQFRSAVEQAPEVARYHAALGRTLSRNPHWAREAISCLETAARLEPGHAAHHAELAQVLHAQGLKLRAKKAAEAALRLAPADAEAQRIAAEVGAASEPQAEPQEGKGLLGGLFRKKPEAES